MMQEENCHAPGGVVCKVEIEEVGIHFRGQKIGKVHEDTSVDDMINMKKASLKGHLQHGKRVD